MTGHLGSRRALAPLGGLLIGLGFGTAAWGEGRLPVLAVALPVLIALSASRSQAFCIGFGYGFAVLRFAITFIGSWFGNSLAVGFGAVFAYALCSGLVWSLAWSGSDRPWRRAGAVVLAWLVAVLPPMTVAVPGHPLTALGYLLPGWAWLGVVLSAAVPALAVWVVARYPRRSRLITGPLAVAAFGLAAAGYGLHATASASVVRGVQAVSTEWGELKGLDDTLGRMERMGRIQPSLTAVTLVWPESILGRYNVAAYPVLELELLRTSRRAGRVQVIGMDIPLNGNRLLNSAVAFYPDGTTATATARQPAPFSLWKPWRSTDTFLADWRAYNMLRLGQGDRAAVIFCYEEYLPSLYLLNEAFDSPTIYLALTNTWAAQQRGAAAIQTWHSLGMAKLFGRDYLKAENRPAPAGTEWSPSVAP